MPKEMITWVTSPRSLDCRVCGVSGAAESIAEINAFAEVDLEAVRCANCGSLQLVDAPRDFSPNRASIDSYVESGAGIGTMAEVFAGVDHRPGIRFLDVGCNYPFALDLARFLYGWDVRGIEPSPAGARGGRELRVDVRSEFLNRETRSGTNFDLVLASEVIEHVPDPLGFLRAIRERMTPDGTLIMTTPAAEIVRPDVGQNEALQAASPGFHVFLASVKGMELLLSRAGFGWYAVTRDRGSLRVSARISGPAAPVANEPVSPDALERYYEWRSQRSRAASSLALGLALRLFRLRVARGNFEGAAAALPRLLRCMRAVHGVDLRNPDSAWVRRRLRLRRPLSAIGATFSIGMFELIHRDNPARASAYFQLSESVALDVLEVSDIVDGDSNDLRFQAPFHRALALARFSPTGAAELAMSLSERLDPLYPRFAEFIASRQCRVYTELVSRGTYQAGSGLDEAVAASAAALAGDDDGEFRMAGLDAVFSLGMSALQSGDATVALGWFSTCAELTVSAPTSPHTSALLLATRKHQALAEDRIPAGDQTAPSPSQNPGLS